MDLGRYQRQRLREHRSATLDETDRQRPARAFGLAGRQREPERCGRCVVLRGSGSHQEAETVGRCRERLQTPQRIVTGQCLFFGQPCQQRTERRTPESLLDGPQSIGRTFGADDQHATHVDAELLPAGGIGYVRRREQHDLATGLGQRRQRVREETDLAHTGMRQQQLGQAARRPAAAGQFFVERPKPARRRRQGRHRQRVAAPEPAGEAGLAQRDLGTLDEGGWRCGTKCGRWGNEGRGDRSGRDGWRAGKCVDR